MEGIIGDSYSVGMKSKNLFLLYAILFLSLLTATTLISFYNSGAKCYYAKEK